MKSWQICLGVLGALPIVIPGMLLILRGIKFVARGITWFDKFGPVLVKIAEEFEPNSGSSMCDKINRIEVCATRAVSLAEAAEQHVQRNIRNQRQLRAVLREMKAAGVIPKSIDIPVEEKSE